MKIPRQNLRTPGPTPCPDEVLQAMGNPMINHRGPEFYDLIQGLTEKLKQVYMTKERLFILTASGTGALEATVVNTLSPGDKVLAVSTGYFGDRFADLARAYGTDVIKLDVEWGLPADPDTVRQALRQQQGIKAVMITHNETSTGVVNDLESIATVVKSESDALLLVDAVSSLASIPLSTDQWRCDVVATASQKGLMVPPGLSFVSVSEEGWKARESAKIPRFYFDFSATQRYLERGQNPWTPGVSLLYGLDTALNMILEEGLNNVFDRHVRIRDFTRAGIRSLGLELLAEETYASSTVTAVKVPTDVDAGKLSEILRTEYSVVLAGGQGTLQGKIFRIGHMGKVTEEDITEVLGSLEAVLPRVGFKPTRAAAD